MNKVKIPPDTWGYKNFITDQEQKALLQWALNSSKKLKSNGPGRFYNTVNSWDNLPEVYFIIKKRIIETEQITKYFEEKNFGDFLSMNLEGGYIATHSDPNDMGCIHTRFNLLISLPDDGGNPIYNEEVLEVEEKMLWRCQAGKYKHASLPVIGKKPRINLSYGFQIPIDS